MIILTEERALAAVSCITDQNGALRTNSQLSTSKNFKVSITWLFHQQRLRGLRTNPGISWRGNLQSWANTPVMLQVWGSLPWVYQYLYLFCGQTPLSQRLQFAPGALALLYREKSAGKASGAYGQPEGVLTQRGRRCRIAAPSADRALRCGDGKPPCLQKLGKASDALGGSSNIM